MATELEPATMRRLAFIRYLVDRGVEQTRMMEPLGAAGLLTIHDSVELFLYLASEHFNVVPSRAQGPTDFQRYFKAINSKLGSASLAEQASMLTLNKARVSLKHYGIHPSTLDLDAFRTGALAFFTGNTPLVFGHAFADVSLAQLVLDEPIRGALLEADRYDRDNELSNAATSVAVAFAHLLKLYHIPDYADRPFRTVTSGADTATKVVAEHLDDARRTLGEVAFEVRLLRFGIDTRRLAVFRRLTPNIFLAAAGNHQVTWNRTPNYTHEHIRFCYDFVVRAALQAQSVTSLGGLLTPYDLWYLQQSGINVPTTPESTGAAPDIR